MNNKNEVILKVKYKDLLFNYIIDNYKDKSKNNIKAYLKNGQILVNDRVISKFNYIVNCDDVIIIRLNRINNLIDILYEDNDFLIVNKPDSMLTVADNKERVRTLYHYVSLYVKKKHNHDKVFIVNRLDRDTSGIVVFAKNEQLKMLLQKDWNKLAKKRSYMAVVHGNTLDKGVNESYLKEDKTLRVYSVKDKSGLYACDYYFKIKSNDKYSLVNILLKTGRKNQIRVHMNDIKHPIVGDSKYGISDKAKRMYLHADGLELINPITHKLISVESKAPSKFYNLVK